MSSWITLVSLRDPSFDCEIPRSARDDPRNQAQSFRAADEVS
jgi:hypothetical protein